MVGERLRLARRAAGLSLRELANRVGVSPQAISKYERGLDIPSSGVLLRLAEALGVKVE
ncbi:MAG: helix-turn-helix transcriptional regulator, partial [Firmicutes bacterium]|nr:helix-turn-helix transcriptional regulator [Bacillota bacterium]